MTLSRLLAGATVVATMFSSQSLFGQNLKVGQIVSNAIQRPDGGGLFTPNGYPSFDGSYVVFAANGANSTSVDSIWATSLSGGTYTKLVGKGTAVPGSSSTFLSFNVYGPPIVANGLVLFSGTDNSLPSVSGYYTVPASGGTISLIAKIGMATPPGTSASTFSTFAFGSADTDGASVILEGNGAIFTSNPDGSGLQTVLSGACPSYDDSDYLYPAISTNGFVVAGEPYPATVFVGLLENGCSSLLDASLNPFPQPDPPLFLSPYSPELTSIQIVGNSVFFSAMGLTAFGGGIYSIPLSGGLINEVIGVQDGLEPYSPTSFSSNGQSIMFWQPGNTLGTLPNGYFAATNHVVTRLLGRGDPIQGAWANPAVGNSYVGTRAFVGNTAVIYSSSLPIAAIEQLGIYSFRPLCGTDVSQDVKVSLGSVTIGSSPDTAVQGVSVKNVSTKTITGPISLALDNLPLYSSSTPVFLANANGLNTSSTPGSPLLILSNGTLAPGAVLKHNLQFNTASTSYVNFTTQVFACSAN